MSTTVQPQVPATPNATSPSSAPPSGAPAGSPASTAPTASPEWRAPASAPAWAAGKTPEEILGIATQLNSTLEGFVRGPAPAAPVAAPQPRYDNGTFAPTQVPDTDYVTGADLNRVAPRMIQDAVRGDLDAIANMAAQNALETVKREYQAEFQRYGPTIYGNLAAIADKRAWTVDNLRKVVKYSLADHVDEIARDKAARLVSEMEPTLRSNGSPTAPVAPTNPDLTIKSEKLPAEYRRMMDEAGVTEDTLDEFLRGAQMSREQFFQAASRNQVITETRVRR